MEEKRINNQLKKDRKSKGITLIALVVTLVVLLILAGIILVYVLGDNSIFKQTQDAKLKTEIAKAREKLEVTLGSVQTEKLTNKTYNEADFLDEYILKQIKDAEIIDDVVIVDGYAFELDRSEPKIKEYIGKKEDLVFPDLEITKTIDKSNEVATISIKALEREHGINKIEIILEGNVIQTYTYENLKDEITENYIVGQNGEYTVKAYSQVSTIKSIEIEGLISVTHLKLEKKVGYNNRTATIVITAKEMKQGINKIEVMIDGKIIKEYNYENRKDEIIENYVAERNGNYTVKVYSEASVTDSIEILGLIRIAIGDYVDYVPDDAEPYPLKEEETGSYNYGRSLYQDKSKKWRIMNIDSNGVDLISETSVTDMSIYFANYLGFNNGVYILNDICKKQYSNEYLGATGRSINLLDIEKHFSSKGLEKRNAYESAYAKVKYGDDKMYYNSFSPDIYDNVAKTTAGESLDYYTSPTSKTSSEKLYLPLKQTYYYIKNILGSDFTSYEFCSTVFTKSMGTCWIATRYTDCFSEDCLCFGIRQMEFYQSSNEFSLNKGNMVNGNRTDGSSGKVRPVVHLNSNIKISEEGGTADNPKTLTK